MTEIGGINNKKKLNYSYAEILSVSNSIYFSIPDEKNVEIMDTSYPDIEDVVSSSKDNNSMTVDLNEKN